MTFWVFGYGSLMWKPGFTFINKLPATLYGAHRRLCVYSHVHRGTPEAPGLVLGLDRGGSCKGLAFEVAKDKAHETLTYLRAREQVTMIYHEVTRKIRLADDRCVAATVFVVDRAHLQYAGQLDMETQFAHVHGGFGQSGPNRDYVVNTNNHLIELGVKDEALNQLVLRLTGCDRL